MAAVAPCAPQNPIDPELGVLGFQPPEVTDVRMRDSVPHQDQTGGTLQTLIVLTGNARNPAGPFSAVWRDQRDGLLGLYFERFDAQGRPLEPERPLYSAPATARRTDPVVVLRADGSGAVTWISILGPAQVPWIRCFDAKGSFLGEERPASPAAEGSPGPPDRGRGSKPAAGRGDASGRSGRGEPGAPSGDPNCKAPALVEIPDGYALAWTRGGLVQVATFGLDGSPRGAIENVNPADMPAEPGIALAANLADPKGDILVGWRSKEGTFASRRTPRGYTREALGAGTLHELLRDRSDAGYVALFALEDKAVLRHVSDEGKLDRPDVDLGLGALAGMQIANYDGGLALVAESGAGASGESGKPARGERADRARDKQRTQRGFALHLFDDAGKPREGSPIAVPSESAREIANPRVASNGKTLFVAWTDSRNGDSDVYGRSVDPARAPAPGGDAAGSDARLGPEVRLNTDRASSDQLNPTVAANGDHGVVVWQDRRNVISRIYARRFTKKGFDADEFLLPVASSPTPTAPNGASANAEAAGSGGVAAVRVNGEFLVSWKETREGVSSIRAQIFRADGTSRSAAVEVEAPGNEEPSPPHAVALPGERGYALIWARGRRGGAWVRRMTPDGTASNPARRVSETGEYDVEFPNIAGLDDGRLFAAWDVHDATSWTLRGRFLDDGGETRGSEITFEHSRRANDWDPSIAPADAGGFALAWCSGTNTDPTRDVCCRLYDSQAHPKGPILTPCFLANEQDWPSIVRLSDKSFAVAWEDDVSYYDQVYVRRMLPNGREMGPMMRLNETETRFAHDRTAPHVAALGDGLAAAFGDRRRSLGMDANLKTMGPRWDAAPKK